ncbi:MAG TPA: ribosomal protein S18-alanine N-acetyltransferase [Acidimicrobiales bacterium]|nr:ribosomal protein S18-alanine N-acetyltransferase [Acidimicrobiales bacterium]
MTTTWKIRAAERRDVNELLKLEVAQFPEPWTRTMLLDEIENTETRRYSVAVEHDVIVGYLGLMFILEDVHVNTLGTLPGHEGRGVATSLLHEGLDAARLRGATRATLEVAASNARAQALYFRFGFQPVGVRRNYYERTGEDALVLWADLPSREGPR